MFVLAVLFVLAIVVGTVVWYISSLRAAIELDRVKYDYPIYSGNLRGNWAALKDIRGYR